MVIIKNLCILTLDRRLIIVFMGIAHPQKKYWQWRRSPGISWTQTKRQEIWQNVNCEKLSKSSLVFYPSMMCWESKQQTIHTKSSLNHNNATTPRMTLTTNSKHTILLDLAFGCCCCTTVLSTTCWPSMVNFFVINIPMQQPNELTMGLHVQIIYNNKILIFCKELVQNSTLFTALDSTCTYRATVASKFHMKQLKR